VPEHDPAAIAEAIKRLATDRERALDMAGRGRDRVRAEYDSGINHQRILLRICGIPA
jgi:glycosyltransferase involved in cell wall biosynthesis